MIIDELMRVVWKGKKEQYEYWLNQAKMMADNEIYNYVSQKHMTFYSYPGTNMNLISCSVCTYRKDRGFSGCSMCDYENDDLMHQAFMAELLFRDRRLYAKAIKNSFQNVRGQVATPNVFELVSNYDVFNDQEFPEEVFQELFKDNQLFKKKPFSYILETRASSVTPEKLSLVRKYISEPNRVMIECGVETVNEWIRNHWLNKGVSNKQIETAILQIHAAGYKASADVLIGIPGFTEQQSINQFVDTIRWLDEIGVDQIIMLPLNRKENTLHGVFYRFLRNDDTLRKEGLSQGEHTGVPWLNTIYRSIHTVLVEKPEIRKKLNLAQVFTYQNSVQNVTAYNLEGCRCNQILIQALFDYQKNRKSETFREAYCFAESPQHECYSQYLDLLRMQKTYDIQFVMETLINRLAPFIWPTQYADKVAAFERELDGFEGGESTC